jgi:WD40 repeat protein
LVFTGGVRSVSPSFPTKETRQSNWIKFVQKQFSIFESSGSITQIACRNGGGHLNARVMIGACATQEERYNRVGEIIMAYKEKPTGVTTESSNYEVLILDGHKKAKSTSNGQVLMRQTVTCVVYDPLTDFFFSGGYDGDVVAWNATRAVSVDTVGSHPKPINSIACHSSRSLVAYGCQSGGLYYFDSFSELGSSKSRPSVLFTKPKAKDSFSNTIDHVAIPAIGANSNTCYAGIGYLQSLGAGVVEAWDLGTGSQSCSSDRLPNGVTCINLSPCGTMLATGTGGIASDDVKGDGVVRIMDLGQSLKTSIAIKTEKYDLDCVSFCSRSTLLFMGETSDSSIAVYDLRFPNEPLFTSTHGNPSVDSVVAHAWLCNGTILATGGHDGQVNLWDCQRGFSLINKFEFNSSISCITYSDSKN